MAFQPSSTIESTRPACKFCKHTRDGVLLNGFGSECSVDDIRGLLFEPRSERMEKPGATYLDSWGSLENTTTASPIRVGLLSGWGVDAHIHSPIGDGNSDSQGSTEPNQGRLRLIFIHPSPNKLSKQTDESLPTRLPFSKMEFTSICNHYEIPSAWFAAKTASCGIGTFEKHHSRIPLRFGLDIAYSLSFPSSISSSSKCSVSAALYYCRGTKTTKGIIEGLDAETLVDIFGSSNMSSDTDRHPISIMALLLSKSVQEAIEQIQIMSFELSAAERHIGQPKLSATGEQLKLGSLESLSTMTISGNVPNPPFNWSPDTSQAKGEIFPAFESSKVSRATLDFFGLNWQPHHADSNVLIVTEKLCREEVDILFDFNDLISMVSIADEMNLQSKEYEMLRNIKDNLSVTQMIRHAKDCHMRRKASTKRHMALPSYVNLGADSQLKTATEIIRNIREFDAEWMSLNSVDYASFLLNTTQDLEEETNTPVGREDTHNMWVASLVEPEHSPIETTSSPTGITTISRSKDLVVGQNCFKSSITPEHQRAPRTRSREKFTTRLVEPKRAPLEENPWTVYGASIGIENNQIVIDEGRFDRSRAKHVSRCKILLTYLRRRLEYNSWLAKFLARQVREEFSRDFGFSYHEFRMELDRILNCDNLNQNALESVTSLETRVDAQTSLIYNLASQRDNELSRENGEIQRDIAAASKRDSSHMKSIAILTMSFLPATFVSTMFSMSMFNWQASDSDAIIGHNFWIFWAVTVPLTLVVILSWDIFTRWRTGREVLENFHIVDSFAGIAIDLRTKKQVSQLDRDFILYHLLKVYTGPFWRRICYFVSVNYLMKCRNKLGPNSSLDPSQRSKRNLKAAIAFAEKTQAAKGLSTRKERIYGEEPSRSGCYTERLEDDGDSTARSSDVDFGTEDFNSANDKAHTLNKQGGRVMTGAIDSKEQGGIIYADMDKRGQKDGPSNKWIMRAEQFKTLLKRRGRNKNITRDEESGQSSYG